MGALVVSWIAKDGVERLYTSELTPWEKEVPIVSPRDRRKMTP